MITTIAIIILCLGGLTDRLLLSAAITSFITSTYFSHTLAKSIKPQRLGIGVGVSTSIISLVICAIVLSFIDVDPSRFSLNSILILMLIAFVACGNSILAL
jgi:hypothetical protein